MDRAAVELGAIGVPRDENKAAIAIERGGGLIARRRPEDSLDRGSAAIVSAGGDERENAVLDRPL